MRRRGALRAASWAGLAVAVPAAGAILVLPAARDASAQGGAQPRLPEADLVVATVAGPVTLRVELAETPEQRARGMMFRPGLPAGTGMLFDFQEPQPVSFWMRNTLIPLDMVFIAGDGRVMRVHPHARPRDETPIASGVPVRWVLELAGGEALRLKIAPGDRASGPALEG